MSKHTILIIEDDPNLRDLYHTVLSDNEYEVEMAADGQEGLLKLQQGGHELTLLDMMLPNLNGVEVLKELQVHPVPADKKPNGIIVLMTNVADEAVIKQAEELGATSHIMKSEITPTILLEHVTKLLST